ncbi:hypothetical protein JOB18_001829 [Solea senegalensis]|uniref:Uncharacterized protein n=1 Tax=Solea senegalensis TaxID=28829 RepID=A0AAV6T2Y3_SOLSE|nr:hypothetical protein JOB18_001829 [Solea senegalensis]
MINDRGRERSAAPSFLSSPAPLPLNHPAPAERRRNDFPPQQNSCFPLRVEVKGQSRKLIPPPHPRRMLPSAGASHKLQV